MQPKINKFIKKNNKKKNEVGPLPYTICKINSEWIKDLNVKPKTIKLFEENRGEKLYDIGIGNDFLDSLDNQSTGNKRKNKLDYI